VSYDKLLKMDEKIKYGVFALYFVFVIILGYCCYPGVSTCEEDTQIYLPLLLRAQDGSLLKNDLLTRYPHTAFTLYDELVLFISRSFGSSLTTGLTALQIISRCLLLASFFLVFTALECPQEVALGLAGLMMMGGTIPGVQILIVEFESVPRGIAFSLTLLALAFIAHRRVLEGTFLGCLGLLVHPTTTLPFWIGWSTILTSRRKAFSIRRGLSAAFLVAAVLLLAIVAFCSSPGEQTRYFLRLIDPPWEKLLRLRVPYVFVSEWSALDRCLLLWAVVILCLAYWRCRPVIPWVLIRFVVVTGFWAAIMVLASWVFLDRFKLAVFPQLQPARALIFMVVSTLILSWTVAVKGLESYPLKAENHLWALSGLFFALDRTLLFVLWPLLSLEVLKNLVLERDLFSDRRNWIRRLCYWTQLCLVIYVVLVRPFGLEFLSWRTAKEVGLAVLLNLGLGIVATGEWISRPLHRGSMLIVTALFFLALSGALPKPAGAPDRSEIRDLAEWARKTTPVDSVFLFPDADRDKSPGVFRYYANRAVYVDWKSGGQINFSRAFAIEWWERWKSTMEKRPAKVLELSPNAFNFVVTQEPLSSLAPKLVYKSQTLHVYRIP
jgi:hypothetical protein